MVLSAPDFKRFEEVQQRILGQIPGNSLPNGPPITPTGGVTPRSKPSFETLPDKIVNSPTVSLPSQAEVTAADVSMFTIPDSEQFITEFFKQDFGSTPTVKIPRVAHSYNAVSKTPVTDPTSAKSGTKKILKNSKGLSQSSDIFCAFGGKDFINTEGLRFYPVHIPGGGYKEIPFRAQDQPGRLKCIGPKKKSSGRRNGDVRNDHSSGDIRIGHDRNENSSIGGNETTYNHTKQPGTTVES
jgi:hypothetical protein